MVGTDGSITIIDLGRDDTEFNYTEWKEGVKKAGIKKTRRRRRRRRRTYRSINKYYYGYIILLILDLHFFNIILYNVFIFTLHYSSN